MTATWPSTRTGKRLAACPGRLPVGGEQERLPDGSLTELRMMRSSEIAVAIEAEATAAAEQRLREGIENLRGRFKGIALPPGPDFAWVDGHRPFIAAALAVIDDWAPPSASPRQGEPVELDVERLARAFHEAGTGPECAHVPGVPDDHQYSEDRPWAAAILAALTAPVSDDTEGAG